MLIAAIVCFVLTLFLGLANLTFVIQGKKIPRYISLTHGPLALTGLILLIVYSFQNNKGPIASLIILLIAAVGGATMFYQDITGKKISVIMALVHGFIAFLGVLALIIYLIV